MREDVYYLLDPGGNRTLLAAEQPGMTPELRSHLGRELMALEPTAEQAGFVSGFDTERPVLEMAGGEFCGNATLAAAVLYAEEKGLCAGKCLNVSFRVSGAAGEIPVTVERLADGWQAEALLPGPEEIGECRLPLPAGYSTGELPVVRFPGISHVILEEPMDRRMAEACVRDWCRYLGVPALGLMFYKEDSLRESLKSLEAATGSLELRSGADDEAPARLTPLVYVDSLGSLFWEGSCASGSSAVAAWLRKREGRPVALTLREPAGGHQVSCEDGNAIRLAAEIRIEAERALAPAEGRTQDANAARER